MRFPSARCRSGHLGFRPAMVAARSACPSVAASGGAHSPANAPACSACDPPPTASYVRVQDGRQVFLPILDSGHQTDILISDGPKYFRLQVNTVAANGEDHVVHNCWNGSNVDAVIYFAINSNWGVTAAAFTEEERPVNQEGQRKSTQDKNTFMREFHKF